MYQREIAAMNRLATFARIAGIVTVTMFVVLVTRTPAATPETTRGVQPVGTSADAGSTYLPAQYIDQERAAHASELPAQF
jgi:hypothetical protein